MIDTIVLRLHDLRKHSQLVQTLELQTNQGFRVKTGKFEKEELEKLRGAGFGMKHTLQVMEMNRTGEYLIKTEFGKRVNNSFHYAFAYRCDFSRDFIEFNFSIPKYKFGTNIMMWVEHYWDRDYSISRNILLTHSRDWCIKNLKPFIFNFFSKEFAACTIDPYCVEVNRLDLCFNQLFPSKEEALRYLSFQKKIHKKHAREDNDTFHYKTALMHKSARSSFKVYHKGTEYRLHDRKEHLRVNNEKGYEYFKIDDWQKFSDRILRYELTLRNAGMNYLFKHHIFRKDCPQFKIDYANYLRISGIIQRNETLSKRIGELPENEREAFRKYHPYERISKNDRLTFRYLSSLMERTCRFMLRIDDRDREFNERTVEGKAFAASFSRGLIARCMDKFTTLLDEFQLRELPDAERLEISIERYNQSHRKKLQKNDLLIFYSLWQKHGSFKAAAEATGFSRATFYRYKQRFQALGINERHVQPDSQYNLPTPKLDLADYHYVISTTRLINGIKLS